MTTFSENLRGSLFNADLLNEPTFKEERKYLTIVALSADRGRGKGVEPIVMVSKKSWSFLLLIHGFSGSYLKQKLKDMEKSMRLVRRCFRR
jgi:hypothetical protein